ncbi:NUDIX domain-containing protein [Caballeronia sp. RCC_10]|jgi:8-oxo-dGTP pyrophosphatase MutT (NUDIX family)|uniref:NUDIX domain-containing protein n=1 Tax=Caballeronia sp. RCC_10 TaxID=3239227 RepID=UPI0035267CD9
MPYDNPHGVAVGLLPVMRSGRIELAGIVRGKFGDDGHGKNALFGGYVDKGESIEQAIAREAEEEIGFLSTPSDWRLMHSRHVPEKNINLVFCLYRSLLETDVLAGTPMSDEVSAFLYIDQSTALAFPLHEEAVRVFYTEYVRLFFDERDERR